ncbi:protein Mpv17-like isoform X2 [Coccinella septempunctata]|uniref:protein Mpv17-like isoform X2 n=1 Tax=Coccinella septempunctata TaxID=41139 RepID=UPI001D087EFD|nr:protein Mpv17-like isoform X2 [Coccinella septempunctata]
MNRIIHSYQKLLSAHPFLVQTVQTGVLMGVGDVTAQRSRYFYGGSGKSVVLKKVGLDQLCFSPTFIGCFLCALGFAQGKDFQQIRKDISRDYQDILLTNYKIWPLVQLGNFYLTPLQYQTLVVQAVAICWNTYISWKTQLRQQDKIEK